MFVRIRISPPRIKRAAIHFAWWFISVQGRQSQIFVNLFPQKPKIGQIGQCADHAHEDVNITKEMHRCKLHARDVPVTRPCISRLCSLYYYVGALSNRGVITRPACSLVRPECQCYLFRDETSHIHAVV